MATPLSSSSNTRFNLPEAQQKAVGKLITWADEATPLSELSHARKVLALPGLLKTAWKYGTPIQNADPLNCLHHALMTTSLRDRLVNVMKVTPKRTDALYVMHKKFQEIYSKGSKDDFIERLTAFLDATACPPDKRPDILTCAKEAMEHNAETNSDDYWYWLTSAIVRAYE